VVVGEVEDFIRADTGVQAGKRVGVQMHEVRERTSYQGSGIAVVRER